ncbi:apolipoprotein N-acyltransferase [Psychromonas sp. MME2]|uniref:apolipoprotein N-acyltransferase n=1 Tax=unclassified Psychromonas TaxID=2614957 RepID=UPI00339BF9B1
MGHLSLFGRFFLLFDHLHKTTKHYFLVSFTFSIAFFIGTIHWVYVSMDLFGGMPMLVNLLLILILCAYLALFPTLALWLNARFFWLNKSIRYLLLTPVLWLISDWLRGFVLTGFPWAYLGYSHADTPLVGYAPILGVQGVTLAIMIICGALALLLQREKIFLNITLICILFITGSALKTKEYTDQQPAQMASLVQGNIAQKEKWLPEQLYPSLFKYLDLSETGLDDQPELIIWPESAIAALELDMQNFLQPLSESLAIRNKTLITGIIGYTRKTDQYYNTIIALGKLPAGSDYSLTGGNRYQKHHLLPIGEFVPFENLLRPLAPYFNLPMSSFARGSEVQNNLQSPESAIAAALCYEIAFPELLRQNITATTGTILTISNDAWFGNSIGPDQHLQIARMRAIEFARPLLRVTNNGVTAMFDRNGDEIARLERDKAAVLSHLFKPAIGKTPYQNYGSIPLQIYCTLILLGVFIYRKVKTHN